MRIPGRKNGADVFSVTDAVRPYSEDIDARRRRYLFWMAVRTVCFILAIVLVLTLHGQARVIAFFAVALPAIFLPMLTVVFANAGREPHGQRFAEYRPDRGEVAQAPDREAPGGEKPERDESLPR